MALRGNEVILAQGQTGNLTGSDLVNDGFQGVVVFTNINTATAATITVTISGKSPVGTDEYYTILTSAAYSTTGLNVIEIHPALTEAANVKASNCLPPTWRITVAITGTVDYDIAFAYIP